MANLNIDPSSLSPAQSWYGETIYYNRGNKNYVFKWRDAPKWQVYALVDECKVAIANGTVQD